MTDPSEASDDLPQRRSLLTRYRWLLFSVATVILLPTLLTVTGRQLSVLRFVHPKLGRAVQFQAATTHWWAPVQITDVRMKDLTAFHGENTDPAPLLTVASVTTDLPLWKLVMSMGNGVKVTVTQPIVNVRVHDGRTNVEDTFTEIFGTDESTDSGPAMPVSVTITDGIVRLISENPVGTHPAPLFTTISNINGTLSTLDQTRTIPDVVMIADIGTADSPMSRNRDASVTRQSGVNPRIAATLDELAADFPRIPFSDTDMAVLQSDESQPSLSMQISAAPDRRDVQNLVLEARNLDLSELEPVIQRILPGTVCVGDVSCRLQAHFLEDGNADGFAGRLQLLGENIRWRNTAWAIGESLDLQSVSAQGAVALAEDGFMVNDLRVRSALLDLSGNGEVRMKGRNPLEEATLTQHDEAADALSSAAAKPAGEVNLTGRVDFARLTQMLPRTLNVDESVKAESAELRFSCRVQEEESSVSQDTVFGNRAVGFGWRLAAETSPIQVVRDGNPIALDSSLRLDAIGSLTTSNFDLTRARIAGAFGSMTADPIDDGFAVSGTIDPERLWNDVRQLIDVPRPGISSEVEIAGHLRTTHSSLQFSALKLSSTELEIECPALTVFPDAPVVQMFDGTATVNGAASALKTLIAPWYSATWLSDEATVSAKLGASRTQNFAVQAVIERRRNRPQKPVESDSSFLLIDRGRIDASLVADSTAGHYRVERGSVELSGLTASVSGTIEVNNGLLVVDLDADTQYDLDQLTAQLLSDPSRKIQLTGVRQEIFHLEGAPGYWTESDVARHQQSTGNERDASLLKPLTASGRVSWDGGRLYGLALGEGAVVAELRDGRLRTEPIRCSLGTGEINVMPQWDMTPNLVQLAPGTRIQNLEVTPELSREWLGYVAPIMSDAANVQGTISARLQQFDYFLDRPSTSTIAGELSLTNVVAAPGPSVGPLLQLLSVVDRNSAGWVRELNFPNQVVPFEMRNGMVNHDGLRFGFGDYVISSRGGVGADQRIRMVLTVPIEKNAADPVNARTLQIPVGGTVTRPQLDTRGLLQNLGRQQIQNQVDKQIERGLNKLFDKLR